MIQIEPYLLWLGHAGDGRDVAKIMDAGIEAAVQLAIEEPPLQLPREIVFVRIPLYDGTGNSVEVLRFAVKTVEHLLASKVSTLLCCSGGMSRSPAIAGLCAGPVERLQPERVAGANSKSTCTDVSPGLWQELLACFSG